MKRLVLALDSIARHAMREQSSPGLSVAIVKDGEVLLERGFGVTADARDPASPATVYQIASITKQFTAAAILRLAEQGKIDLDAPITRYVDGLSPAYEAVTIQRLLNHTAGVPNFTEFFREFRRPLSQRQLVDSLAARPLLYAPGTGFHYSNSGYYLLGMAIERVSGEAFPDYLRHQFWAPLGMTSTHYCGARPDTPLPVGFVRDRRGQPVRVPPWDPSVLYAAGSLCSTAADLAKWEVALGEGRVLTPASYAAMTTPSPAPERAMRMAYGYGMMVDTIGGSPYLHHDGAVSGFRSQVAWYPNERLAVVVLTNQGLASPEPIERDITRAVLGFAPAPPSSPRVASTRWSPIAAGSWPY